MSPSLGAQVEGAMTSIRVRNTLRLLCCLLVFTTHPLGAAGQGVEDAEASARKGKFQQAFAQCRAVLATTPAADDLSGLRALFSRYPRIQESGVAQEGEVAMVGTRWSFA